jgi:hypothetical protein
MKNKRKIKPGTVLIAIDPCEIIYDHGCALVVGQEYKVISCAAETFTINSEIANEHCFYYGDYKQFFKIKK